MSDTTGTPHDPDPGRRHESVDRVTVRRAPRYYRFMALGAVVGVIVAVVLTFAFPEQEDFTRLQVFGFTGLFLVAVFVALAALLAILIDRVSRRRARVVTVQHVEEHGPDAPATEAEAAPAPARDAAPAPAPASGAVPAPAPDAAPVPAPVAPPASDLPQNDEKA